MNTPVCRPLVAGRHFVATWALTPSFGGMTNALLHRSKVFFSLGKQSVEILTFAPQTDFDALRKQYAENNYLNEGVTISNIWEEILRDSSSISKFGISISGSESKIPPGLKQGEDQFYPNGEIFSRKQYGPEGKVVSRIDYYGVDGKLVMTYLRPDKNKKIKSKVSLFFYDSNHKAIFGFSSMHKLYSAWLDTKVSDTQKKPSWLIADSKSVARLISNYRRNNVYTLHVIHNSHLGKNDNPYTSRIISARAVGMKVLHHFDAAVFLTQRQRTEYSRRFGKTNNLTVIPNSREWSYDPTVIRNPYRGIMLCSLDGRKRPKLGIQAVKAAREMTGIDIKLDIYGEGKLEKELIEYISSISAEDYISLKGHIPHAAEQFRSSGFSLLTSTFEGLPLVLPEAMGRGCIPIAFDLRYGPSDVIEDGRTGFLVPQNDVEAMSRKIAEVVNMTEQESETMRLAARTKAHICYLDQSVVNLWNSNMKQARNRRKSFCQVKSCRHDIQFSVGEKSTQLSGKTFIIDNVPETSLRTAHVNIVLLPGREAPPTRISCRLEALTKSEIQWVVKIPYKYTKSYDIKIELIISNFSSQEEIHLDALCRKTDCEEEINEIVIPEKESNLISSIPKQSPSSQILASSWQLQKPNLQISELHRFYYIHLPKCGGTSIDRSKLFSDEYTKQRYGHARLGTFLRLLEDRSENFKGFALVRHPWTRLQSAFYYLSAGGSGSKFDTGLRDKWLSRFGANIESFLEDFCGDPQPFINNVLHMKTAGFFLNNEIINDAEKFKIIKLEDFNNDVWQDLCCWLGVSRIDFPQRERINQIASSEDKSKLHNYLPADHKYHTRVCQIYSSDMKIGGYTIQL